MTPKRGLAETAKVSNVLVVDDDRRVRELLEIALTAHGFGVLTASDGDEAIRRALGQRPDLVVLDVRLPKKSGLEVCDALRGDAEDPTVPIILVSAAVETDTRLQAFARGADDYLAKPFSPKELIARIKRHLARHADARASRRRATELERELAHAHDEARRAEGVSRREQELRELQSTSGREFLRTLDPDALADRILTAVQRRLEVPVAALFVPEHRGRALMPRAVRGAELERIAKLELLPHGELARFLAGLDRPMLRADLERIPELRPELGPFMTAGFSLFVPLRGSSELEAMIVTGERPDGRSPSRAELDVLAGLCESAAVAIENGTRFQSQLDGLLDVLVEKTHSETGLSVMFEEAARLCARAARRCLLAPRVVGLVRRGVALGAWSTTADGRHALARLSAVDSSGRITELESLLDDVASGVRPSPDVPVERWRAPALLAIGWCYADARAHGALPEQALAAAVERVPAALDPPFQMALASALDETIREAD